MTLTLNGLTHPRPDDIDILLVSPLGQTLVPMSDTGGVNAVSGVTLTLSDSAASLIPDDTTLVTGTFRPTSVNALGQNAFPSPAPAGPYNNAAPAGMSTFTSLFGGTNPNGTWSLYVVDDALGQAGSFASGACLSFTMPTGQHVLTTSVSPPGSGIIMPATGFFDAGTSVQVTATANTGFTFVNFSGDLTGAVNPQSVVMDVPRTVVANFTGTPTTLTALISAKSGPSNARVWTVTITNTGAGTAASARINSLALTQTGGAACTPSIIGPSFPLTIGNIAPGGSLTGNLTLNFTGCPANARFTAVIGYGANNGAITNSKTVYNQFQ
jgi:hypothetical protein